MSLEGAADDYDTQSCIDGADVVARIPSPVAQMITLQIQPNFLAIITVAATCPPVGSCETINVGENWTRAYSLQAGDNFVLVDGVGVNLTMSFGSY